MAAERHDRYTCHACGKPFAVAYDDLAFDEARELTPVACPHCDGLNYASVTNRAASSLNYWTVAERRDRHECQGCRKPFVVVYDAAPAEPAEMAVVECPHCGWVNYASVAKSALGVFDARYRVEKLPR